MFVGINARGTCLISEKREVYNLETHPLYSSYMYNVRSIHVLTNHVVPESTGYLSMTFDSEMKAVQSKV